VNAAKLAAGDVGLISYPNIDGGPDEIRPVLILNIGPLGYQEDEVVLIAEITADEHRVAFPRIGDVRVSDWEEAQLNYPSVVRCRQIRSFSPAVILHVIGKVGPGTLIEAQRQACVLFPPNC
jgi:mRNA-degrading endonuclease toxin of MazEF toxin-antitoxin module